MGSKYSFKCENCDLQGIVAGGPSAGFLVITQTGYCRKCNMLIDYDTEFRCEDLCQDDLNTCHLCGSNNLLKWNKGEPCPQCGGNLPQGKHILHWD